MATDVLAMIRLPACRLRHARPAGEAQVTAKRRDTVNRELHRIRFVVVRSECARAEAN